MTGKLADKVALITGGGTGIGEAIARRFHLAGASVAISGRRLEPLMKAAKEIDGLAIQSDTTIASDCEEAVKEVKKHFGGLDILVANAGIMTMGDVTQMSEVDWNNTLSINVSGVMQIARAAIPVMLEGNGGAIINISSVAGLSAGADMVSYTTSKHAVMGLTKSMAIDNGPHGIRVNALCPGWVETPMSQEEMHELAKSKSVSYEEAMNMTVKPLPLKRMAHPDEIAACAEFLASEDASFVTGTTLVADGGGEVVDVGTLSFT